MRNKNYLIILVIMLVFVIIPKNVNAETILKLGEEEINTVDNTNDDGTAMYSEEDNTLILDNYVGGPIIYYGTETLTIILNNTNEISSDYFSDGISLENAGLILSGKGELSIHEISNGIYIENGDLTIDEASIEISNIYGNAVMIGTGSVTINGSLTTNDDIEKKETEIGFAPAYQVINIQGGDIVINGDLTVTNARKALLTDNDVVINSGKINITTFDNSIDTGNKFELNGGNVEIEIDNNDDEYFGFSLKYGIVSGNEIDINGGNIHIKVPENAFAIAASNYADEVEFNLSEDIKIEPVDSSIQSLLVDDFYNIKTIGLADEEVTFDDEEGFIFTNGVNEVSIYVYTYEIESVTGKTFNANNIDNYKIVVDGDYNLFDSITIDGIELEKNTDYTVTEGSTIIEFTSKGIEKLNTLMEGTYNVIIKYLNNKNITSSLKIEKEIVPEPEPIPEPEPTIEPEPEVEPEEPTIEPEPVNPNTHDNVISYAMISLISLLVGIISIKYLKSSK